MDQKRPRAKIPVDGLKRPRQDAVAAKQASQFPAVGVTLPNYKYDPSDQKRGVPRNTVVKKGRLRRIRDKITLKRVVIIFVIIALLVGGWLGYKFISNAQKAFGGSILDVLKSTKLDGEENGRVNIVLAGNSADDAGHNGAELTDSIMIMSIDTRNNKAFLLSVPRDLYISTDDGDTHEKINQAYVDGEESNFNEPGYAQGGMGQLEKVIDDSFGLKANYYALVNYNALKQGVDAVGGVDFTVKSKDPRGLFDPNIDYTDGSPLVKLSNGVHHLNGQDALNLSRARGDSYRAYGFPASDFDRTANQRALLVALKSKVVSSGVITNPAKLSKVSDVLGDNVKSDMKIDEVKRLFELVKDIPSENIRSLSLNSANGKNLLESYTTRSGQSTLIPAAGLDDFSDIQTFILQQTSSDPVVQEASSVVVLNGTQTTGLAAQQKAKLIAKRVSVDAVGDAREDLAVTSVIDVTGGKKPATSKMLTQLYGNVVTTTNPYAGVYDTDFIVIVGADKIPKAPATNSSTTNRVP